jgi:hypothetical protein
VRDSPTLSIHQAKRKLSLAVSLFGGSAIPFRGLFFIMRNSPTRLIHSRQIELRGGISFFGQTTTLFDGLFIILRNVFGFPGQ